MLPVLIGSLEDIIGIWSALYREQAGMRREHSNLTNPGKYLLVKSQQ